ncbi:TolC family protein [Actimicrobium sp. CCI2.3]|uniref:TolC family protein n=1 Tax=Actimicrobium sp. CCI2.3 TaxID=3048616 RepID=UPI002AB3C365|nr:TolC family protein [Actimicrobium sp. CCI2.3]MDY7573248.1 TolC family protein [Actimicrobium sp. CCI2.3]MEB0022882.1 TolC family protein [Actimicrobium sp. CCI2.3]
MKHPIAFAMATLMLGGCASFSPDGGFDTVATATRDRLGKDTRIVRNEADVAALADAIAPLLSAPLSVDSAVQVALLNNRGLQATYQRLGLAEADLVQAGRLQNPRFGFKRTHEGSDVLIDRSLTINLVNLLTAPLATRIESRRFEQTRLQVADAALNVAADTRRAYYDALGAVQQRTYARQVSDAAQAGAELGTRMAKAGNWSALDMAREQSFHADALTRVSMADKDVLVTREKLVRLLGLANAEAFTLPDRLPDLPVNSIDIQQVDQIALRERLDIAAGKLALQATAASLNLTRSTRFVNALEIGGVRNASSGNPPETGYELSLEIPLFDWGTARVARAESTYMQGVHHLADTAIIARSEARESYGNYRLAYQQARHYRDEVMPLRKRISDQTMLRYNGMLVSVFELLADSREQASAAHDYIGALKNFWIADSDLQTALGGRLQSATQLATQSGTPSATEGEK